MKISIIGAAGTVGSCAAFNIAINNIADELVMIGNVSREKLENQVTDLSTAMTGHEVQVRAGSYSDMADSEIVIMAAGPTPGTNRQEVLSQNLSLVADIALKIKKYCPEAVVINATNPIDPLNYAMWRASGLSRKQFLGYSMNDTIRFRMFLAEALKVPSSQVEALVIGEHGASQVPLFSSVKIKGDPIQVTPEAEVIVRQRIAGMLKLMESQRVKAGRTQGWTTSMGLTALCRAISRDTQEVFPCSVVLEGEYGLKDLSISVSSAIGKEGIHEVRELKLNVVEKEGLDNSIRTLQPAMEYVKEFLRTNKL